MSSRTYHDPLHGAIRLDRRDPAEALAIDLIDTAPFQRLRRIRQLGPAFLTFHGAESSRFTHSLGVLHLARQALRHLEGLEPRLAQQRPLVYAAALLHDLGHAPLSHTGEDMYGLHHEGWSCRLIREHPALHQPLEQLQAGLAEQVASLLEGTAEPRPVLRALVSSQLDCDRLDYLLRDSYSTGASYGHLDLERILSSLTLAPDGTLAVHPKGLMAVEHYLVVRQLMYRSVYNHRLNVACNWLLAQLIQRARELGPSRVPCDATMARWIWHPEDLDLETFLANDDLRTGYHLMRWQEEGPPELAEPSRQLLDRRLPKALDVADLTPTARLELLAEAHGLCRQAGLEGERSCALYHRQSRGYDPYRRGLRLWDGERLQALEQRSPLVASLIPHQEMAWLIHPAAIAPGLKQRLSGLRDQGAKRGAA